MHALSLGLAATARAAVSTVVQVPGVVVVGGSLHLLLLELVLLH